jgi:hypothetical protein
MRVYAVFSAVGLAAAFYSDDIYPPAIEPAGARNAAIPAAAVEIEDALRTEWLNYPSRRRWDGKGLVEHEPLPPEPVVPSVISDRQFAQALALAGTITEAEALAWAARGELPEAMEEALDEIPEAHNLRFGARMMLAGATTFERTHPLTEQLGGLLGYDPAALDALWTRAAAL